MIGLGQCILALALERVTIQLGGHLHVLVFSLVQHNLIFVGHLEFCTNSSGAKTPVQISNPCTQIFSTHLKTCCTMKNGETPGVVSDRVQMATSLINQHTLQL